ncbi:FtsK/SpoIIIE domain-containing protein [Nesterenkonia sphaerica]|uniref:DUF87 domain-containing protein n=1 Tax=Nesterenkonia sphaerica TaxID=1804988 RepID=A0A5R9AA26_9MICC|nr:FtsK/SpoIIIE domain-containing protein [Nesterenkonia sphaerica]TLP75493.1 DUF87 domain-containing protein [Nesterenkonia sphaerica]
MDWNITVVHAPGALSADHWAALRRQSPGIYGHELRFVAETPADSVSGAALDHALREILRTRHVRLSTAGYHLHTLDAGSPLLHPGMVVLVSAPDAGPMRWCTPQLKLCIDSGPDAGQLVPLRRGNTTLGRGRAAVRIADPSISREEAILDVGTRAVTLHRGLTSNHDDAAARLITEVDFQLGSTTCHLAAEAPEPRTPQSWPPAPTVVDAQPPEGKHKMMLAFALVPLIAGVVLVAVTGMWFFLLFSGASALIASAIFWDGRRKLRHYRRRVAHAASSWASRASGSLCSPGRLTRDLRAGREGSVHAGATDGGAPTVRLGTGLVTAEVEGGTSSPLETAETLVTAAVGITLLPGEQTSIHGSERDSHRLLRWLLIQLTLNPAPAECVIVGGQTVPEVRDLTRVWHLAAEELAQVLEREDRPSAPPGLLILADPEVGRWISPAIGAGWHVLTPGAAHSGVRGWAVDLRSHRVERQLGDGSSEITAENLSWDGLSEHTLQEQLRLALPHQARTRSAQQIPDTSTYPLPDQMFTGTATETLTAVLGRDAHSRVTLDLVGDGPHLLIAGTTGSGKSELLKTLLVSLCAEYGPNELGLVLIDFKGGAAFHRIGQLPHALGLVTDLSQAAAERTLEGIRSELVRRERLFLDAGAGDYCEYRHLCPDRPLPRILVVIDEFRIFSHELPDQLDELMRLATLGRSLGLHLVLSTQRPQGVVTADIRANIGASICLRVRSEDESRDVIGSPLAAEIPRNRPGRAALRTPGERPTVFQSAQLTGHRRLRLRPEAHPGQPTPPANFSEVIAAVGKAASEQSQRRLHTPLLPPLPETLIATDRLDDEATSPLLGRTDDPALQRQQDLVLSLQEPQSIALVGEVGAGAAAAAAALTAQLLDSALVPDVYLLDGDRSLAGLGHHRRVGSWLTEEDPAEVEYLLNLLCDELTRRRVNTPPDRPRRPLLLVVTGYAQWNAAAHSSVPNMDHLLGTLASEGPQAGIAVVVCGGRELAMGKLLSRFPTRVYLPLGSSEEARYLWPKLRSADPLPGRGVLLTPQIPPPGLAVQLVTEKPHVPENPQPGPAPPLTVAPLPERILYTELPGDPALSACADPPPLVGIQQFTGAPMSLPLGPVNLILGTAGSGKTTCLKLLHQQLSGSFLLTPHGTGPAQPPEALLVDDAQRCTAQRHSEIQQAVTAGVPVVATAAASSGLFTQLPWAHAARTEGSNVILSPTHRSQADIFASIIPVLSRPIPGRAVHLWQEGPVMVQWALPEA